MSITWSKVSSCQPLGVALTSSVLLVLSSNLSHAETKLELSAQLLQAINTNASGLSIKDFRMPLETQYGHIPQDSRNNRITAEKVKLGRFLFHETAVGTESTDPARTETYVCATCHNVVAGFKPGIPQGIADGGVGYANGGTGRVLGSGMDPSYPDGDPNKPDVQPIAVPTVLNAAFQDVALWNGSLGSSSDGINAGVASLSEASPPGIKANDFGLPGLETQVLAGTRVHRLRFDDDSVLQTIDKYKRLYKQAFPSGDTGFIPPGSEVTQEALGAAKAIAAYERTLLATKAPFQKWLRGDPRAMSKPQLRGGLLFFGKANCVACHQGPAFSSMPGASEDAVFHSIGFNDFDTNDPQIHGDIPFEVTLGRGGFTGEQADEFKFKVPPLYNLKDANVYGHGSSFRSLRDVIDYKNAGVAQNPAAANLSSQFVVLGLSLSEVDDLMRFVGDALYDPKLRRYVPNSVPSGSCFPAADFQSALDLDCIN